MPMLAVPPVRLPCIPPHWQSTDRTSHVCEPRGHDTRVPSRPHVDMCTARNWGSCGATPVCKHTQVANKVASNKMWFAIQERKV